MGTTLIHASTHAGFSAFMMPFVGVFYNYLVLRLGVEVL